MESSHSSNNTISKKLYSDNQYAFIYEAFAGQLPDVIHIEQHYPKLPIVAHVRTQVTMRNGATEIHENAILAEHRIDVYINDILTMKLMCMAEYLPELVLGRMLTEGIIKDSHDVKSIYINETGKLARVILNHDISINERQHFAENNDYVETTQSCCTENHILNDLFASKKLPNKIAPISWHPEDIFKLSELFSFDTPLHRLTGGSHSCYLFNSGTVQFQCEDLGRHNAIDKCLGYALRHGLSVKESMLYTSGRLTTDMVLKAIRAGLPVIVSKAVASADAVAMAKQFGLTIISSARPGRYKELTLI